jgi:hypothetical protein
MTQINQLRNDSKGNLSKERALSNLKKSFAKYRLYAEYENVKNTFLLAIKIIQEAVNHKGSTCFYDDTYYGDGCIKSLLDILLSTYKTDLEILVVHDGFNLLTDRKISTTSVLCILCAKLMLITSIVCVILIGVIYIFIMPICVFLAFYLIFCGYRCTNYSQHSKIFRNFIKSNSRYVFSKNYKSITHYTNSRAKVTYTNGDKYEGGWFNGQPHGDGSYTFCNHDEIQGIQGNWLNGDTTSMTVKYHDNRQYNGELRGDQPHGVGCFSIDCNYAINEVQYYFYGMDFNSFIVSIVQNKLYDLITPNIFCEIVDHSLFIEYLKYCPYSPDGKKKIDVYNMISVMKTWSQSQAGDHRLYHKMMKRFFRIEELYINIRYYQFTAKQQVNDQKFTPKEIFIIQAGTSEAYYLCNVGAYLSCMAAYLLASFEGNVDHIYNPLRDPVTRKGYNFQNINKVPDEKLVSDVEGGVDYKLVKSLNSYQLLLPEI